MPKILSLSSQVVYGHVGNSVNTFVFQRFGYETLALPTILLSNHKGYPSFAGEVISIEKISQILETLMINDQISDLKAITTGYLPTAEHVNTLQS